MQIAGIELDDNKFPAHIGLIMDGNSRWAKKKRYPKIRGHRAGLRALKKILKLIETTPSRIITIYAFSKENWKRTAKELDGLFSLLRQFYKTEYPDLKKRQVKILHSGDTKGLEKDIIQIIKTMVRETKNNKGKVLNLALNYSGRDELTRVVKKIIKKNIPGKNITENLLLENLDNPGLGEIDLLIRTSGELRISNFCLWQLAYSELYFTDTLWPDFTDKDFALALLSFQKRNRRFGGRDAERD